MKEQRMPDSHEDWNAKTIAEFRANNGGGKHSRTVLVHHRGRKSGREYVNPLAFMPDDNDSKTIYIFASKAGGPKNPDWYHNLTSAGEATVEVGAETYHVSVREITGADRDRIYEEQKRRMPVFADYEKKAAGIRTIPVIALTRD
jgi:deazaflavin-dependent oxidoreductase (nitroreductase family)